MKRLEKKKVSAREKKRHYDSASDFSRGWIIIPQFDPRPSSKGVHRNLWTLMSHDESAQLDFTTDESRWCPVQTLDSFSAFEMCDAFFPPLPRGLGAVKTTANYRRSEDFYGFRFHISVRGYTFCPRESSERACGSETESGPPVTPRHKFLLADSLWRTRSYAYPRVADNSRILMRRFLPSIRNIFPAGWGHFNGDFYPGGILINCSRHAVKVAFLGDAAIFQNGGAEECGCQLGN